MACSKVPFWVQKLVNQHSVLSGCGTVTTKKYPSDNEDQGPIYTTMKYPSDNEDSSTI